MASPIWQSDSDSSDSSDSERLSSGSDDSDSDGSDGSGHVDSDDANLRFYAGSRTGNQDEPRRISRARQYALDALLAAFSIVHALPVAGESLGPSRRSVGAPGRRVTGRPRRLNAALEEPWKILETSSTGLSLALRDKRVWNVRATVCGLQVLNHFIQKDLTRAANDKAYIRHRLSQSEAKSIRPFLKQWEKLVTAHAQDISTRQAASEEEVEAALVDVPMPILCRIAIYALSPPLLLGSQKLDLSRLRELNAQRALDELDLIRLLRSFGVQSEEVTRISLAHNNLTHYPIGSSTRNLPGLVELDMTHNPNLTHLPLSFSALQHLEKISTTGTRLATCPSQPALQAYPRYGPPAQPETTRGAPSLTETTISLLLNLTTDKANPAATKASWSDLASHLPPHLARKFTSAYICEECNCPIWLGGERYLAEEVESCVVVLADEGEDGVLLSDGSAGKVVRLRGRVCTACAVDVRSRERRSKVKLDASLCI